MSEEILYIDDGELVYYINENEFVTCNEIPTPMLEGIKHLQQKVEQQEKEIERLNNIINELEKFLNKVVETGASIEQITCKNILNYLQALKEGNKQ